jgi:hypothetical protein
MLQCLLKVGRSGLETGTKLSFRRLAEIIFYQLCFGINRDQTELAILTRPVRLENQTLAYKMTDTDVSCLRIALIAENRPDYVRAGYSEEDCAALTHDGEVYAVSTTLKKLGHHVTVVAGIQSLVQHLATGAHRDWDLAFNMAQGFHGSAREAQVPGLLEAYQIPYTFADAATMALCQNKAYTKVTAPNSSRFSFLPVTRCLSTKYFLEI